jgi:hypothetical protein
MEERPAIWRVKGKGKAVPLQAWSGPEGSRKLRFPDFLTTAQDGGKVVSLTHRPYLPPGISPGGKYDPRAIARSEGFMSTKISMTSGIEPAQYLHHCATAVPPSPGVCRYNFMFSFLFNIFKV